MMQRLTVLSLIAAVSAFSTPPDIGACFDPDDHLCKCHMTQEECRRDADSTWQTSCDDRCSDATNRCYKLDEHDCKCDLNGYDCRALDSGIWTDSCIAPCIADGNGAGCYNHRGEHRCDCSIAEADCNGTWTDACSWCGDVEPSSYGCYDSRVHRCDCTMTEEMCTGDYYTWTDGCNSCLDQQGRRLSGTVPPVAGYGPRNIKK